MLDHGEVAQSNRVAPAALDQGRADAFFILRRRKPDSPHIGVLFQALQAPFPTLPGGRLGRPDHAKAGALAASDHGSHDQGYAGVDRTPQINPRPQAVDYDGASLFVKFLAILVDAFN